MYPVTFPSLGIEVNINPVAFNIFGKGIFWYGIIIVSAMIISIILAKRDNNLHGIKWDDFLEYISYALVIGVVCARIYYVAFEWEYYRDNLCEILKIWNGGIAIYGGIIGAILTAIIFCKKKKVSFLSLADFCVPYLVLSQSIGRWGNFVNREAYGTITDSFFRMGIWDKVSNGYIYVHPTFLYESFCTFIIFIILFLYRKKSKNEGELFYIYMMLYGIVRAIVEGYRVDSLYLYNYRISQVIAIIFAVLFGILLLKLKINNKNIKKS